MSNPSMGFNSNRESNLQRFPNPARIDAFHPDPLLTAFVAGDNGDLAGPNPQGVGEVNLVFVRQEQGVYVARRVRVLAREGGRVRIAGGVHVGDLVVTTGSFLLKTETLKDSIGAGCCDVE